MCLFRVDSLQHGLFWYGIPANRVLDCFKDNRTLKVRRGSWPRLGLRIIFDGTTPVLPPLRFGASRRRKPGPLDQPAGCT